VRETVGIRVEFEILEAANVGNGHIPQFVPRKIPGF